MYNYINTAYILVDIIEFKIVYKSFVNFIVYIVCVALFQFFQTV